MRKEARVVLDKKVEEIRLGFERWLAENHILLLGEVAVIEIRIEKTPLVLTKVKTGGKRILKYSNKELQPEDWDKILSVPFSKKELTILEMIRQDNNQPISRNKIREDLLKQLGRKHSVINEYIMNARFSKGGLPYRVKTCSDSCIKLFIAEF